MSIDEGGGSLHGVMINSNNIISKFELHWHYYTHFCTNALGNGMDPLISFTAMSWIVPVLFFYKDGFGIR